MSYTEENQEVNYNKGGRDYSKEYFTIEALGSGNITWNLGDKTVQYSKNGGSWETMNSATTISVVEGDEVRFKGNNSGYSYYDDDEGDYIGNNLVSTVDCNVYGNIMSLTDGDDFENADTVNDHAFPYLFYDYFEEEGFRVVNAKNLILPATTLADYCYNSMFDNCTSLTSAPELPATTLANNCYQYMFSGCTYLNYIKCLAINISATNCTTYWLNGVPATGTFVKNPSMTGWTTGVNGIPTGWTVQDAL